MRRVIMSEVDVGNNLRIVRERMLAACQKRAPVSKMLWLEQVFVFLLTAS